MRTTDSHSPESPTAGQFRAAVRRAIPAGVTTLAAAGLVLGAVAANAQPAHPAVAAPQTVAVQNTANITTVKTTGNLLHTTSFENRIWPWVGTHLIRQQLSYAPYGKTVVRTFPENGSLMIDDWPGEISHSSKGATYTASMMFAAAVHQSWEHDITLVVREHGPKGHWIESKSATMKLRYGFKPLTVSLAAVRSADVIDVYAYQSTVYKRSSFFADKASLTSSVKITPTPPTPPPTNPTPPPTSGGSGPSTLGLLAYATGQPTDLGDTSRYAYVVVQENQFAHIAAIKRQNPNTKVLAYMQAGNTHYYDSCSDTSDSHLYGDAYGVSYCWANKHHPHWFLTDRNGNRLRTVDYNFLMPMDVGNTDFADAWATGTYANLKKDGFDGVWMDDVNIDPGHGLNGRIKQYSDEQYGAATTKFASIVGDYMRSHGMISIANVGLEPWVGYQLDDVLSMGKHLTAVNREHYVRYGDICGPFGERFNNTANNGTPPLSSFLTETKLLQAQGTKITGVDYGYSSSTSDDLNAMTYGRALFLLSWDGTAGSAYFFRKCGVNDTSASQWTASLGTPTGAVVTLSDGVMTRTFTKGMVVLNPNRGGSSAHVKVTAGLHLMSGAKVDGGVYVAPQTAAILSS